MNESELQNDIILRACRRQVVPYTPVWLMRQAGRYLPEFRELRLKYDFFTMCRTPEIACEVTLQPLKRFPVDAVIIFSDILVIPQALGFELKMQPSIGPVFEDPLDKIDDINRRVIQIDVETVVSNLNYVYKAILETISKLNNRVPLIGFAGAPWTLMCYMVDGSGEQNKKGKFSRSICWLYEHPDESRQLLNHLAILVARHLIEQIKSGARLVQLFDSWAGYLTPSLYRKFGLPTLEYISKSIKKEFPDVPLICFPKGAFECIKDISNLNFDVISLDSSIDLTRCRREIGNKVSIQGNMDPLALLGSKDKIENLTREMLESFGKDQVGYIANLGHGCLPSHSPENIGEFIDCVHSISREMINEAH